MDNNATVKKTARLAGLIGLIMGAPLPFSLFYVPARTIVAGDARATANNLLAKEYMFRMAMVGHLFSATVFVLLAAVLYRLFRPVNGDWAKLMAAFVLVQVPLSFFIETVDLTSLMVVKGGALGSFSLAQRQDLSMFLLGMGRNGISVQEMLWGAWLLPYGLLVYRSGFIPRILGILLLMNGLGYIVESMGFLLLQKSGWQSVRRFTFVTYFGEVAIMLWYLAKGVKNDRPASRQDGRMLRD